ncbi:E3 ubiquitin-protein ligase Os04g0590900-like [Telopea speciosissima]|uniref:E3 ubiquitin-protein ligase Os04g0590900-like n=1 Tax=Telopea speciosissima TaxID=54955 RepID=UPI001CC6B119|nr:E3 ubiquitin-protein ligase Os04g0590900-like [Telopea speciosissima]
MGSVGSPQTWVPSYNIKDCSQGFCSSYCPQWCYIMFPPPPPYEFPDEGSNPNFSPLVIAIIGILASAFLLASYYILISKYCGRNTESLRRTGNHDPNDEFDENRDSMNNEPWQASTGGLDETLIKSITVCKYNKGDGFVEETDCSVCLNEFQEDERVRLLPKCSHAFHLTCIDTWLRAHSNCPLCRANIVIPNPFPLQLLSPVHESPPEDVPLPERRQENDAVVAEEDSERGDVEENSQGRDAVPKTPSRATSDLGQLEQRDTIIEIRAESTQHIRRSVSMDYSCQSQISIADILGINQDDDSELEDNQLQMEVGSLKPRGEHSKSNNKSRSLHCVMSPIAMKRSFSSGRLFFTKHGRGRNTLIPM